MIATVYRKPYAIYLFLQLVEPPFNAHSNGLTAIFKNRHKPYESQILIRGHSGKEY
jgi:hypothetical protein